MPVTELPERGARLGIGLARVLLVDDDVTSRLTLQTVLRAGGYTVEVAASAAEAVDKLDTNHYDLVLSDLHMESDDAGLKVLAHARHKEYRPATALVTSYRSSEQKAVGRPPVEFMVETEGVQGLLMKVADLIGLRAIRRIQRLARQSAS